MHRSDAENALLKDRHVREGRRDGDPSCGGSGRAVEIADAVLGKGFQQRPAAWLASMLTWCLAIDTLGKVGWMEVEGDQVRMIIDWA